ncbi:MAG: hypothetical protein GY861_29350 [bacterium]|nr:hypothetical protein [bacterium]
MITVKTDERYSADGIINYGETEVAGRIFGLRIKFEYDKEKAYLIIKRKIFGKTVSIIDIHFSKNWENEDKRRRRDSKISWKILRRPKHRL